VSVPLFTIVLPVALRIVVDPTVSPRTVTVVVAGTVANGPKLAALSDPPSRKTKFPPPPAPLQAERRAAVHVHLPLTVPPVRLNVPPLMFIGVPAGTVSVPALWKNELPWLRFSEVPGAMTTEP
jgi:hypothetical protein